MADERKAPPKAAKEIEARQQSPHRELVGQLGGPEAAGTAQVTSHHRRVVPQREPRNPFRLNLHHRQPQRRPNRPAEPEPWSSPLLERASEETFRGHPRGGHFPKDAVPYRGQGILALHLVPFSERRRRQQVHLLTDETAVDYPKREKRFEIIYHLYSFKRNDRLRLKVMVGEAETVPSVVSIWPTANWMEREVYDMFGVAYEGHPDLKRILSERQSGPAILFARITTSCARMTRG